MAKKIVYLIVSISLCVILSVPATNAKRHPAKKKASDRPLAQELLDNRASSSESDDTKLTVDQKKEDHPCAKLKCGHGRECVIDQTSGEGHCECIKECAQNLDTRRKVCSNHNTTWESDCHLHQRRCLCEERKTNDCTDLDKHMHIDYYGVCQEIPECKPDVLDDFPRRMREWLYNIMTTRAKVPQEDLDDADGHRLSRKWVDAVIWKFCDLDTHPHDRYVSRHELFPLRAPFISMEPCISEFLNKCDPNDDHKVTLVEWGECLGAPEGEMEDKCTQFKSLQAN